MKTSIRIFSVFCLLLWANVMLTAQTTPLSINGRLKIINRQLCNEAGTGIQLRGMSSHGLQWFPQCYTAGSFQALANDWGADVFRAAMYVDEGGYTTNPTAFRARIVQLVNWAEQYGMYCLIDWHILNPGDPNVHTSEAISFFSYMAQQFAGKKNVIYEICNEPNGVQWSSIKSYAEQVIPAIRQYDPQGIILVGTPNYSGTPWDLLSNPLSGANAYNVMYTYHFYSGSHYLSSVRSNMENVLAQVPLFVSEWGTSNYSGNGGNDYTSAQTWMDFLAGGNNSGIKVSWTNWNFADKDETSSALTPGACNGNAWNSTSTSGAWVKDHILNPADNFGAGTSSPAVVITSPANNSTAVTGSSLTINASVSNGTASAVQFYDGSNLLGSDNTAPYSWTVTGITAGSHSYTAKAVLSSSNITSTAVMVTAGAAANQAPSVSVTAPANNATFTAPATINITATASDADGSVTKVEFYNGTNKLGETSTAPYSYSWANVAAGTYSITAKATDNSSATTTSAAVSVQVNAPGSTGGDITGPDCVSPNSVKVYQVNAAYLPNATSFSWWCTGSTQSITPGANGTVTINFGPSFTGGQVCVGINYSVDPWYKQYCKTITICSGTPANQPPVVSLSALANNATYAAPATVNLSAMASDADGSVAKVEFYNGSNKLGESTTAPYNYSWTNVAAGNYTLTAKATDNAGAATTSGSINISVTAPVTNQPPSVSLTAPANNATYTAPASIMLTAAATDADGSVTKVEFYNGGNKLGESTTAPYSYSWTNVAVGNYSLTAKATDNSNATTTSAVISVVVNNSTPANTGSGISGPDCAAVNSTLVYQLGAADRVNATGYSWWVNGGSTQSITPGANGTVTINFGPYFTGGQLVAGVNYSAAPWYKQFTKNLTVCSGARTILSGTEISGLELNKSNEPSAKTGIVYPTPTTGSFTFIADKNVKKLLVMDGTGRINYQVATLSAGQRITFGERFAAGTYFVQIGYADATRKMLIIVKTK